jgi:hypothetical protein
VLYGNMDGWSAVFISLHRCPSCAYEYVNRKQIQPYWTMARRHVLADQMFPTESSGDFSSHQDLIRGSSALTLRRARSTFPRTGRGAATLGQARRHRLSGATAPTKRRVRLRASPTRR